MLNNTVKNIPIKLKQFLFDSSNKKIKYELLPERDISLNTTKLIKERFQSFIKIININPKIFPTEITHISNIYH